MRYFILFFASLRLCLHGVLASIHKRGLALQVMAFLFMLLLALPAAAQQCPDSPADLYQIEQYYRHGDFRHIASRKGCLEELFARSKASEAPSLDLLSATEGFMHYYALSSLRLGLDSEAVHATVCLMQRFPRHALRPESDPPAFARLLDSIVPYPIHRLAFTMGGRHSLVAIDNLISLRTDLSQPGRGRIGPDLRGLSRMDMGLEWAYSLSYRSSLVTGLHWVALGYSLAYEDTNQVRLNPLENRWETKIIQKQSFLQVPLNYQLRFSGHRNSARKTMSTFFLELGIFGRVSVGSQVKIVATEYPAQGPAEENSMIIDGKPPRRELIAYGGALGLGYHIDLGRCSLFARLMGQVEFGRIYASGSRYELPFEQLIWEHQLMDQYARLNSIQLAVGVCLPKNYRVKNFKKS